MKCPIDETMLQMTDRNGIEIDYCPQCRGVWLDRGELDKIIDRSVGGVTPQQPAPSAPTPAYPQYDDRYYRDNRYHKKKRKESFLGELFDF